MRTLDTFYGRWHKLTDNIGHVRTDTTKQAATLLADIGEGFRRNNSKISIWHTKHLFIVWESEPKVKP